MTTRKWGSEKIVNTTTAGQQISSSVAALDGGGFVVVWEDASGADARILGQRYDALGNPVGGQVTIGANVGNDHITPSVTALAGGSYYVTWVQEVGPDNFILGKVYDANGGFVRDQPVVFAIGRDGDPQVAQFGSGSIVAWTDPEGVSSDILFRIFDSSGAGGDLRVANTTPTGFQDEPAVAASPDGSTAVIAWRDFNNSSITARLLDASGAQAAPEFVVATGGGLGLFDPVVTWLSDGQFAVAWREANRFDQGSNELKVRIFDGEGLTAVPLTAVISVNSTIFDSQQEPTITALPNGGFVVSWTDSSEIAPDQSSLSVRLQAFDGGGGKIGGEIVVNTTTTGEQFDPSIAALADGRVAVTWTDGSAGFLSEDIRMQIVDPRDGLVKRPPARGPRRRLPRRQLRRGQRRLRRLHGPGGHKLRDRRGRGRFRHRR